MIPWEMGSEFHLFTPPAAPTVDIEPFQGELFVNGRAALRAVVERQESSSHRLWIPSYVCNEVHDVLSPLVDLRVYGDYPDEPTPRFDTLQPLSGDIVLIQDTFGLGGVDRWRGWLESQSEVVSIEDISHSSTQERYLLSPADFVFSSLRKSQPTADGGIIFSRAGGLRQSQQTSNDGARKKLEAMALKALYLDGFAIEKQAFRKLQIQGEKQLNSVDSGGSLSHTEQTLRTLPHQQFRQKWRHNNHRLRIHLEDPVFEGRLIPLLPRGIEMGVFHLVIKAESHEFRESLRKYLIENSVFPAIHWAQDHNSNDSMSVALSQSLLTLPTDYRYGDQDIDRLAAMIRNSFHRFG